jgi:hypothetical protein
MSSPFCSEKTYTNNIRYDKLATRAALSAIPNFRWCISPDGCDGGHIHEPPPGRGPRTLFECSDCGYKHCTAHQTEWHEGETCEQYTKRTSRNIAAEEQASSKEVERISKACPGCDSKIEKIDGCNHMTCAKCRYEFCWCCLRKHPAH